MSTSEPSGPLVEIGRENEKKRKKYKGNFFGQAWIRRLQESLLDH